MSASPQRAPRLAPGWEQARETIADLAAARDVPAAEFPGHKEIYCSNLEGFLGGRFPLLLAERDRYRIALQTILDMGCPLGRDGDLLGEAQKIASGAFNP